MASGVKPDVSHLHAFSALCAIVELKERLRKLEDRTTMCSFMGYKYTGGGYQVWDLKRQVVVKSRVFGAISTSIILSPVVL